MIKKALNIRWKEHRASRKLADISASGAKLFINCDDSMLGGLAKRKYEGVRALCFYTAYYWI